MNDLIEKMSLDSKFNLLEYAYYTFTKFYMKYESKEGIQDNKLTGSYALGQLISFNIVSIVAIIFALSFQKSSLPENFLFILFITISIICISFSIPVVHYKKSCASY